MLLTMSQTKTIKRRVPYQRDAALDSERDFGAVQLRFRFGVRLSGFAGFVVWV